MKKLLLLIPTSVFLTFSGDSLLKTPAWAECNIHGCSQSSVAECNIHGCPYPPMGRECNIHGCPPSPQPSQRRSNNNSNAEDNQGMSDFQFCVKNYIEEGYITSLAVDQCEDLRN